MNEKRGKKAQSPLAALVPETHNRKASTQKRVVESSKKSKKRTRKEAAEDTEERELTNLIFGGSASEIFSNVDPTSVADKSTVASRLQRTEDSTFEIDREGDDVNGGTGYGAEINGVYQKEDRGTDGDFVDAGDDDDNDDDDDNTADDDTTAKLAGDTPAWDDPDDATISLMESSSRLKKLRSSRTEAGSLNTTELEKRLRKRFQHSAGHATRTDWARPSPQTSKDDANEEESEVVGLFSTSASLLASSHNRLPPNILNVVRCPDANLSDPNKSVVQSVHFHPGSDPDEPLLLTAGLDKTLRFFQVGPDKSQKIHGIHFPKLPIYTASFLGNTGNVVVSGRRPFFYMFDAVAGKLDFVPHIIGREEKSWERHVVSPDGRLIAFMGNDGYVVLVDAHSKHWVGDLKMNGHVRAITFSPDGKQILASGSDADVYRWDVNSRRCVERFRNIDGSVTASLAASSDLLAVGAASGVVNLYSEHHIDNEKQPLKSIMNLHSSTNCVRFNHDGQILALSTRREKQALRLLHVPSRTVFSNWPTSKTPLNYAWSMDFSPASRYFAVGNDKGKCLLYRLGHYQTD